jgi:hypothetical protein
MISAEAPTPHHEQEMYNSTWEVKFQLGEKLLEEFNMSIMKGDAAIYFPLETLKSQSNSLWEKIHHCLCTYHLINKNLSEKTSNEKIYIRNTLISS